jgi:hypothetical protein
LIFLLNSISIIKLFSGFTLAKDIKGISNLLADDGEFQIQDEAKATIEVGKQEFVSWYAQKLVHHKVRSVAYDQCIGCSLGKSVVLFNNGQFPRQVKDYSERSKTGLMLNVRDGKIKELNFCFVFLKAENKYQHEAVGEKINDLCAKGYTFEAAVKKVTGKSR